jgi:hypothetical protein
MSNLDMTESALSAAAAVPKPQPKPQSYYDNAQQLDTEDSEYLNRAIEDHPEEFRYNTYDDVQKAGIGIDPTSSSTPSGFSQRVDDFADRIARITFGNSGVDALHRLRNGISSFFHPDPQKFYVPKQEVLSAIKKACAVTGCDYNLALSMVGVESGFNTNAANPDSSAKGLFQALNGTADTQIKDPIIAAEIAKDGGYNPFNPYHSALVGTLYAVKNQKILESALGHKPSAGEMYLSHFLGASGAVRVLRYNKGAQLNLALPEAVYDSNPTLRKLGTVGDLIDWADHKMASVHVNAPSLANAPNAAKSPPRAGLKVDIAAGGPPRVGTPAHAPGHLRA